MRNGKVTGDCSHGKNVNWRPLEVEIPQGKTVTYRTIKHDYVMCPRAPIRDVANSWKEDHIYEPNYNTGTYNLHSACHQNVVSAVISRGVHYVFFLTSLLDRSRHRWAISGYYRIKEYGETAESTHDCGKHGNHICGNERRLCLKAEEVFFLREEDLIWINKTTWKKITARGSRISFRDRPNPRWLNANLSASGTQWLLDEMFGGCDNAIDSYIDETRKWAKKA